MDHPGLGYGTGEEEDEGEGELHGGGGGHGDRSVGRSAVHGPGWGGVRAYIYTRRCRSRAGSLPATTHRRAAAAVFGPAAVSSDPPYAPHGPTRV